MQLISIVGCIRSHSRVCKPTRVSTYPSLADQAYTTFDMDKQASENNLNYMDHYTITTIRWEQSSQPPPCVRSVP